MAAKIKNTKLKVSRSGFTTFLSGFFPGFAAIKGRVGAMGLMKSKVISPICFMAPMRSVTDGRIVSVNSSINNPVAARIFDHHPDSKST